MRTSDPICYPGTNEPIEQTLQRMVDLRATPGEEYVIGRRIPVEIAEAAGLRFTLDFAGRAAVVQPLYDRNLQLVSLHARYIEYQRGQDKMCTIGLGGGTVNVLGGWKTDPLIIVEGLFDALSLAACGWSCAATIGRWVSWLREAAAGRAVWLAMDAGSSGDKEASRYAAHLCHSSVKRMLPPGKDKDWNTALKKRGRATVWRHVAVQIGEAGV